MIETSAPVQTSRALADGASLPASPRMRYLALDGLRGVAALAVALFHLSFGSDFNLGNAVLAVDLFFILSGFVITHAYAGRLASGLTPERFLLARIVRLYPLALLGLLLGAAHYIASQPSVNIAELVRLTVVGGLFLPELYLGRPVEYFSPIMPLNVPAWSLLAEFLASVLFAFGCWRGRTSGLLAWTGLVAVLFVALVWYYGTLNIGWSIITLPGGIVRVVFEFGLGVYLYRLHQGGFKLPAAIPYPVIPVVLSVILLTPEIGRHYQLLHVFFAFPLMILLTAQADAGRYAGFCRWSGELSYPLYILHWPVFLWVGLLADAAGLPHSTAQFAIIALLATLAVSYLALRLYDEPVRVKLRPL